MNGTPQPITMRKIILSALHEREVKKTPMTSHHSRRRFWRWLRTAGPSSFNGVEPVSNHSGQLRYALNFEYFSDEQTQTPTLRPAPMKLCPPNHFLHGFRFRRSGATAQQPGHFAALEALECGSSTTRKVKW